MKATEGQLWSISGHITSHDGIGFWAYTHGIVTPWAGKIKAPLFEMQWRLLSSDLGENRQVVLLSGGKHCTWKPGS